MEKPVSPDASDRQYLGGDDIFQLREDTRAEVGAETIGGDDLDPSSEQVLAIEAQAHKVVEGNRARGELDEQVDIAVGPCLVPLE